MAKAQQVEQQVEETVTQEGAVTPESISLQDLSLLANIVDLASQRGAFRGAELTQVGAVFDKLTTFLNYIAEHQKAAAEAEGETATAEE